MTLLLLASSITLVLISLVIYLLIKQQQTIQAIKAQEAKYKHRLYEVSVLKEIQERIGYSLDVEEVITVITGSLRNLFSYTTVSSLVIKDDKLIFKAYVEQSVNHNFIDQVQKTLLGSLKALSDSPIPKTIEQYVLGVMLDDENTLALGSFFNLPLIVNSEVVGIINISSTQKNLYQEEEMTVLYQITNQASNALTKLKQVLATEKGKLLGMIGSLTDGIFMVDINSKLLVINQAAQSMLALEKKNPTTIDVFSALEQRYDIIEKINTAIEQKKPVVEKEVLLGKKTVQIFINPVSDSQTGNIIGASVLLHDITLEKAIDEIREDFTNMMVHELRAPLTAIKGASQLMISHTDSLDKDEMLKLLAIINKQTRQMIDEVSLLLDASKLEAGRFVLQKTLGDLKKIIDETAAIFAPGIKQKNITFTVTLSASLPQIWFDQRRIGQVLNNLISNSLKFTPDGGTITLNAKQEEENIVISVADTGIGIPKEKQSGLFSRFSQVSYPHLTTTTKLHIGTGLGLFFVKGVIEAHGGKVNLQSEVAKGTTVSFTIPLQPPSLALHPSLQPN